MFISSHVRESLFWVFGVIFTLMIVLVVAIPLEQGIFPWKTRSPDSTSPAKASEASAPKSRSAGLDSPKALHLVSSVKLKTLKPQVGLDHHQGKGGGNISVNIRSLSDSPVVENSIVELEAEIISSEDVDQLNFSWLVPDGLAVISGQREGTLGPLEKDEPMTVTIRLLSATGENRQVHLHVYRVVGDEPQGQMAQYNSTDEEKIGHLLEMKARALKQDFADDEMTPPNLVQ